MESPNFHFYIMKYVSFRNVWSSSVIEMFPGVISAGRHNRAGLEDPSTPLVGGHTAGLRGHTMTK